MSTAAPQWRDGRLPAGLGLAGAVLGLAAGVVEVAAGASIPAWIGDKHDPTRLGLATVALSALALASAVTLISRSARPCPPPVLPALGLLLPGLVCFTTVGRLWYLPGALLVVAGALALPRSRSALAAFTAAVARHWTAGLVAALGVVELALGASAHGPAFVAGLAGGLLTIAVATQLHGLPTAVALPLLALATVPFAVLTWWSLVTPAVALLALALGAAAPAGPRGSACDGSVTTRGPRPS